MKHFPSLRLACVALAFQIGLKTSEGKGRIIKTHLDRRGRLWHKWSKIVVYSIALLLTSCGSKAAKIDATTIVTINGDSTRFTVTVLSQFKDPLAYDGCRGIYLIHDTKTGQEFVGVSGVGISELGSHWVQTGKTGHTVTDDR